MNNQGFKKAFFMDKPRACENGQALIFFRQARKFYKISSYQGFTSKQTLILAIPLSFKNSTP